jgi:hypothetical protein
MGEDSTKGLQIFSNVHSHDASGLFYNDDFSGANDDPWADDKWIYPAGTTTTMFHIHNGDGMLNATPCNNNQFHLHHRNYIYTPNFEIRAKVSNFYTMNYNYGACSPGTIVYDVNNPATRMQFYWAYSGGHSWYTAYDAEFITDGVGYARVEPMFNWWMRITKTGTTIQWWVRDAAVGEWTLLRTVEGWTGVPPFRIHSYIMTWTINPNWELLCHEFRVVWPVGGMTVTTQTDLLNINDAYHRHEVDSFRLLEWLPGLTEGNYHTVDSDVILIDPAWANAKDCYHEVTSEEPQMAIKDYRQFRDDVIDQIPADFSANKWYTDAYNTFWTKASAGGKEGQVALCKSTIAGPSMWNWLTHSGVRDGEVLFNFYTNTIQDHQPTFWVRAGGEPPSYNRWGYNVDFYQQSGSSDWIVIYKVVPGYTRTTLGSLNLTPPGMPYQTWYWCRFRFQGDEFKAKYWAEGSPEPAAWHLEVTDDTMGAGGWIGPGCGYNTWGGNAATYYETISIATGDATASNVLVPHSCYHETDDNDGNPITVTPVVAPIDLVHPDGGEDYCYLDDNDGAAIEAYSINGAYHAHVADQANVFSINGAFHTHVIDALGVFNANAIPNSCYHETDSPEIAWPDLQVIEEAYHLHFADTFGLDLLIATAYCYHDINDNDELPIEIRQILGVNECSHEMDSDLVEGMDIALQVAEIYHAHDGPFGALTVHTLAQQSDHDIDSPLVALAVPLLVQEAYHTTDSDRIIFQLEVASSYHGHYADQLTVSITDVNNLVPAECFHFHESQQAPEGYYHLRLGVSMPVNEAIHDHIVDNCAMTTRRNLSVLESGHAMDSDNIDFNQDFIRPADGDHAVVSDNVALGVHLVIAESAHALVDEGPLALQNVFAMAVAEAFHDHVAEVPGIHPWLTVQEASCDQMVDNVAITQNCWLELSSEQWHMVDSDNIEYQALPRRGGFKYTRVVSLRRVS